MGCLPSKPEAPAFRAGAGATFRPGGPDERKELEVVRHAALRVSAAACRMQGWRRTQEDVAVALPGAPDAPDVLLCGVFDGHSGSVSATLAAARMFPAVLRTKAWGAGDAEAALVQGFLDVDAALREARARDGTTAVCAVVAARALWVANCGDSRALL
ncbi:phosphatase 2C-like domain-containing protein, partial [Tribonema minus]